MMTSFFGQPFVKRFAICYRTVVLSVLSLTLVNSGQTAGWIKVKLGMEVGLAAPDTAPNLRPMSVVTKCWMD